METANMSVIGWMDKQTVIDSYSGIFFSCRKEWNMDECYNVDEPQKYLC